MASGTLTCPVSKFSYFQFTTTGSANGGYDHSYKDNESMYIGQKSVTANNAGTNCGSFGVILADFPNIDKISRITSIGFSIKTYNNTTGYNDCVARIEYIGTKYNNYPPLWRVGSTSDQISLVEGSTKTMTTTDSTTCSNFLSVLKSATAGQYHFFRIVRESGQGANIRNAITLTINYEEGAVCYVYNGGWKQVTPYVYTSSGWKQATMSTYNGGWK